MLDEQLYLLTCVFASRADVKNISKLTYRFQNSLDFINAIVVFWPELDDPLNLRLLLEDGETEYLDDDSLLVSLLSGDSDLISMIELEKSLLMERFHTAKNYVDSKLHRLSLNDINTNWLTKRILICNELYVQDTLFYQPLWEFVQNQDESFDNWIHGVVLPLNHMNKRLNKNIRIKEYIDMNPSDLLDATFSKKVISVNEIVNELIPYLSYKNLDSTYELFINDFFNMERFPLKDRINYEAFRSILDQVPRYLADCTSFYESSLEIVFENSEDLLKIASPTNIKELLSGIPNDITLEKYGINVKNLLTYIENIDSFLSDFSPKDIYAIRNEEETAQAAHFGSICTDFILHNNEHNTEKKLNLIVDMLKKELNSAEDDKIFDKLSFDKELSILFETFLTLGDFELLKRFNNLPEVNESAAFKSTEIILLEKYFWQFFNNSSNGSRTRPDMTKAKKTLNLLLVENEAKYKHLDTLLDVSNELSTFSMNLGKGIPFKPCNIIDFKNDPFDIVSILLELNSSLYKNTSTTFAIIKKLYKVFEREPADPNFTVEFNKILSLHIDYSLVNMDFKFAYEKTVELLERLLSTDETEHLGDYWLTIFQVCKFNDPEWTDNEIPTEILLFQMDILSKLLHICPMDQMEAVTSRWSSLEMELSTRDLINDKYSLEHQNSTSLNFLKNGLSNKVSSFLTGL
ncbi:hypothetical protein KAFR_0E04160 [Kazachstania africana CBS 2517]|uniref:Sec39 domain-containing protein n=1 Tax=Kazachstania africana (strain ATCC 22294 / BCRC 22015 / CBS 2517 / CECT 1963 / NBRC 1671 / NRRL Y-8276) TaxID=1071382 RepID=H2AW17_KAZAF|nr:hypothetical protein KAFR_0E04160 [Kazachstania africana CBS 2517]CCF58567.1 hypothetical protein KAFR_0E04160 [Kazachstania africana CBS 2517]